MRLLGERKRVQAEDVYVIIIFFKNIVTNTLESPSNLAENPLGNPGKNIISLLATLTRAQWVIFAGGDEEEFSRPYTYFVT